MALERCVVKGIIVELYDSKADTYTQPTVAQSNADAIRQFGILVNDKAGTLVSLHPEDFTLYRVGSFDGHTINGEDRLALSNGVDVKIKEVAT